MAAAPENAAAVEFVGEIADLIVVEASLEWMVAEFVVDSVPGAVVAVDFVALEHVAELGPWLVDVVVVSTGPELAFSSPLLTAESSVESLVAQLPSSAPFLVRYVP